MKIAFVITNKLINITEGGGAQKSMSNIASAMSQRGHEVYLIFAEKNVSKNQETFYPINEKIKLINIYDWKEDTKSDITLKSKLVNIAIKILKHHPNIQKFIEKIYFKIYSNNFYKKAELLKIRLDEICPDIVLSFSHIAHLIVAHAVKDSRIPFIISHRADPEVELKILQKSRGESFIDNVYKAYHLASLHTIQINTYKNFFEKEIQNKMVVIPNCVPIVNYTCLSKTEAESQTNIILNVGRLHIQKHQDLLIKAFALIEKKHPDWILRIYGDGELENEYKKFIKKHKLENRIFLMGLSKEMEKVYKDAKIFAFPSLWEGFSRAHTEAMAHGLPSVGLDSCTGTHELITKSKGGILTNNNVKAFADAIEVLITNPDLRKTQGDNAKEFVERYKPQETYDLWAKAINNVYNSTLQL
jgi:glycosyltransferase involved in cell wall biosynthesis